MLGARGASTCSCTGIRQLALQPNPPDLAAAAPYAQTYSGHKMPVYGVRWNALHPRIFLSGSADWTAKLWDSAQAKVRWERLGLLRVG